MEGMAIRCRSVVLAVFSEPCDACVRSAVRVFPMPALKYGTCVFGNGHSWHEHESCCCGHCLWHAQSSTVPVWLLKVQPMQ